MQEVKFDASAFDRFRERLEQTPQVIKDAKRQAFEAAAPKLEALVRAEIGGSGRVQSWQEGHVGSEGGYAKARPRPKTYAEAKGPKTYAEKSEEDKPKRYAVGYITNAINNGHLSPRARKPIAGKNFYQHAQARAEPVAQEVGEQIVQALIDHLEG